MQVAQRKTQSASRAARLRFAAQVAEQTEKVGRRIAQERQARKWSRPALARMLPGVATGNDVYRWETGKHLPRADTLDAIAEAFDIKVADLYSGPYDENSDNGDDLMKALDDAQREVSLGQIQDQIEGYYTELSDGLDRLHSELKEIRKHVEPARRKRKGSGS